MTSRIGRGSLFLLLLGLILVSGGLARASSIKDNNLIRVDRESLFHSGNKSDETTRIRCLRTSLIRQEDTSEGEYKYRTLCQADWGSFAVFRSYDSGSGELRELLVDVNSGQWILINDTPDLPPREPEETVLEFSKRVRNLRDHSIRIESSSWRFDPFDGEFLESAKKRVWSKLKETDPDVADLVDNILQSFGDASSPEAIIMTSSLERFVYSGEKHLSSDLKKKRLHSTIESFKGEHQTTDFESEFGKWGESFPDPPRLQ